MPVGGIGSGVGIVVGALRTRDGLIDRVLHKFKSVIVFLVLIVLLVVLLADPAGPLRAAILLFLPGKRGPE